MHPHGATPDCMHPPRRAHSRGAPTLRARLRASTARRPPPSSAHSTLLASTAVPCRCHSLVGRLVVSSLSCLDARSLRHAPRARTGQCCDAVPPCGAAMRCPSCDAAMQCRHAVSPCGAAMRCRHAVPPCGARHAEPVIWLCTQGVTSEIDAEDDSTIVVECTASSGLWIHAKGGLASLRAAHAPCDHHTSSCDSAPRDAASLSFPAECSPSSDPRAARARRRAAHTRPVTRQYRRRTTRLTFNARVYD